MPCCRRRTLGSRNLEHMRAGAQTLEEMKCIEDQPYAKPEAAARRLLEIASTAKADKGKIDVGTSQYSSFPVEGGQPNEYHTFIARLQAEDMINLHERGTYFMFSDKGAPRFA